jgi:histidine triad (HIT) family protein
MYQHAPPDYDCPFCAIVAGLDAPLPHAQRSDVVLRAGGATAFISSRWWPNNAGHVLVVPDTHVENLYVLAPALATAVHEVARRVAIAMKHVYCCDGTSTRQHNEPAGDQEVWHYHLHVFPRYEGDRLYTLDGSFTTPEQRAPYATRLRNYLNRASMSGA